MQIKDKDIARFWDAPEGNEPRRVPASLLRVLYRKLQMLDAAHKLDDLRVPPNNRLEKLKGDRVGQYSIRVNDQFRLCFRWEDGEARGVEFRDYHK